MTAGRLGLVLSLVAATIFVDAACTRRAGEGTADLTQEATTAAQAGTAAAGCGTDGRAN